MVSCKKAEENSAKDWDLGLDSGKAELQALGNVQMSRRRGVTRAKPSGEKQGETEEEETMRVGQCGVYKKWILDAQWKL